MNPMKSDKKSFKEDFNIRKEKYLKNKKLNEEVVELAQPEIDKSVIVNLISEMIKSHWSMIDSINSNLIQFNLLGADNITKVLSEMQSDFYIHIGQLEKLLEVPEDKAELIETGRDEVDEVEPEPEADDLPEVEVVSIEDEEDIEPNEDDEDFPDDINIK